MPTRTLPKLVAMAALAAILSPGLGVAATIDFTDGIFNTVQDSGIDDEPVIFTETADGVTFTFESTLNLVGTERFLGIRPSETANGLHLGGGGGSTIELTLRVDSDAILQSYSTDTGGFFLGNATMDIWGGSISSIGNSLFQGLAVNTFVDGPLVLMAGITYTFDIQNTGAGVQSFIDSFEVTRIAPIPLPGALGLFLPGILGLLGLGRIGRRLSRRRR